MADKEFYPLDYISCPKFHIRNREKFRSVHTGGATPVPIPNTVVKPSRADGTIVVMLWESRTMLHLFKKSL